MSVMEVFVAFSWALFSISLLDYLKLQFEDALLPYLILFLVVWGLATIISSIMSDLIKVVNPVNPKRITDLIYLVVPLLGSFFIGFFFI